MKAAYKDLFYAGAPLPSPVLHRSVDWDKYVDSLVDAGFDGIGEIVSKPAPIGERIPLDDQYYEGLWDVCEARGYPILCHVADPEEFWDEKLVPDWARKRGWTYFGDDYPSKEDLYSEMERVLQNHSKLKIVLCHFYFMSANMERLSHFLDDYKNANLDLALGIELLHNISKRRDDWKTFFVEYSDRILFGTDIGVSTTFHQHLDRIWLIRNFLESEENFYTPPTADSLLTRYKEPFKGLGLPHNVLKKIYSENFKRIWGQNPVEIDLESALSFCQKEGDEISTNLLKKIQNNY